MRAVAGGDDAAHAGDVADAGDAAAALDAGSPSSSCMRKPASVESSSNGAPGSSSSARRSRGNNLPACAEAIAPGVRGVAHLLLERAKFADQRQHLLAIGAKRFPIGDRPGSR